MNKRAFNRLEKSVEYFVLRNCGRLCDEDCPFKGPCGCHLRCTAESIRNYRGEKFQAAQKALASINGRAV